MYERVVGAFYFRFLWWGIHRRDARVRLLILSTPRKAHQHTTSVAVAIKTSSSCCPGSPTGLSDCDPSPAVLMVPISAKLFRQESD